jgi:hypothetical protein
MRSSAPAEASQFGHSWAILYFTQASGGQAETRKVRLKPAWRVAVELPTRGSPRSAGCAARLGTEVGTRQLLETSAR